MTKKKPVISDRTVFIGTCLGYGLFVLYLVCCYAHIGGLHNRYVNSRVASTFYVPKWDLYTASPQTMLSKLYKVEGKKIVEVDMRPFVPRYLFGLDRQPKVLAQEVSVIACNKRLLSDMHPYLLSMPENGDIKKFISADTLVFTEVSAPQITLLRGKYLIAMYNPSTWKERRVGDSLSTHIYMVAVNVTAL